MNNTAIRLLHAVLSMPMTMDQLGSQLGIKPRQTSNIVSMLAREGYVEKKGGTVSVLPSYKTALLRNAAKETNLRVLLARSNLAVAVCALEPAPIEALIRRSGLSNTLVRRAVSELMSFGALVKRNGVICPNPKNKSLIELLRAFKEDTDPSYGEMGEDIIYSGQNIRIWRMPRNYTNGVFTAFSDFTRFGIEYRTISDYFVDQDEVTDINDVLIHAALAAYKDKNTPEILMCCVFYAKNINDINLDKVRRLAKKFEISSLWHDIELYVRLSAAINPHFNHPEMFVPYKEFVSKAELYDVPVENYSVPLSSKLLFDEIAAKIKRPLQAFLIGGENMRIKGLKAATKDIDLVVSDEQNYKALYRVLHDDLGFEPIKKARISPSDLALNPGAMLRRDSGCRIDVFVKSIMGQMVLSEAMISNADYVSYGKLTVGFLRNEHVFLLKAVARREADMHDMHSLINVKNLQPPPFEHGPFDWDMVYDEILHQASAGMLYGHVHDVYDHIATLAEQTGIAVPFLAKLARMSIDGLIMQLLRGGMMPLKEITEAIVSPGISETMVRNRIARLLTKSGICKKTIKGSAYLKAAKAEMFPYDVPISKSTLPDYLYWRFPLKPALGRIDRLQEDLLAAKITGLGQLDRKISKSLGTFDLYKKFGPLGTKIGSIDAARACAGLGD